ncbi:MAG: hypothetical protein VE99_C0003G0007 [candidate division Kazan bacterium GW2011_GWC1_52_13]|uniref:Uncharacterized protein n=1 Tax=candidate division Kazan bacterium GW2011_GWB1_52_7 TaxID=1620414 RepID=A0A0G2A254_UNCK3|nr:MAG: hypothetical protein VE99_C0003G0007 [candidate division Kazan bacterium GW2011_GWC1_52_13]KKW26224.1 MAG: hypothetical protein VF00_C0014G0002 [candidate division Kazan bacterium GW2011_GWB1_52_7]
MKRKLFTTAMVLAFVLALVLPTGAAAALTGATCPAGDVKWETDGGYEYNDGSASVDGDGNQVTISIESGYTFVSGCIKIGGPDGGSTISISGPGTYGPYDYGISHVVIETDPDEPEEPERYTTYEWEADCEGWEVSAQDYEDDQPVGSPYVVDSGTWQDPSSLETATSQYIDETIYEPNGCTDDGYYYTEDPDCEGWAFWRVYGDGQTELVEEGQWTDPNNLESVTRQGEGYNFTFDEPEGCNEPGVTPTPTRPRDNPPPPPKTGGGWELFVLGTVTFLIGGSALALHRFKII